jgi:hypothetical protein
MRSYDRKRTESREMKNKEELRFGNSLDSFSVQKEKCGQMYFGTLRTFCYHVKGLCPHRRKATISSHEL